IEKMKRLGVSIGSHTSAAPVSPEAQPPKDPAASTADAMTATTERRRPAINSPTILSTINLNPLRFSVAHGPYTLKRIATRIPAGLGNSLGIVNIKICLYVCVMERLLNLLRAAAEDTRLRILALAAREDLTVSDYVHVLGQSQPRVSRHLKLLVEGG